MTALAAGLTLTVTNAVVVPADGSSTVVSSMAKRGTAGEGDGVGMGVGVAVGNGLGVGVVPPLPEDWKAKFLGGCVRLPGLPMNPKVTLFRAGISLFHGNVCASNL
jgi:hypothetical protein